MGKWEPKELKNLHLAILEYMLANPTAGYREIGREFDLTPTFVGMLVRSDAFSARLKEERAELLSVAKQTVKDKITHIAERTLDRLADRIEVETDVEVLHEIGKTMIGALGFGPKTAGVAPVAVSLQVSQEIIQNARERVIGMGRVFEATEICDGEGGDSGAEERAIVREESVGDAQSGGRLTDDRATLAQVLRERSGQLVPAGRSLVDS